ncbi:hypothetical protein FISHEDRAFT_66415 [Fistulina hepatica ATCC 64428]|uniref:protein kinase C n=1 Tax=Fistulina hepatica ATCC 64428 TaxID=1128425 RepID=A0A0D7A6C5_9AGAR|nr:hypothetical protein FISHEDRAFT_66415 [Fistulina hepatica ATCC 64428]
MRETRILTPYIELDQKIQDVHKHIQTERKILEASQLLRLATSNQDVLKRNEAKIRETERSLSYFEDTLRELQARKMQQDRARSDSSPSPMVPPKDAPLPVTPRKFTNLDLIKADTPITPAKISKMLHQLEFKLQVEMQYKKGIDKMAKLYQVDGDKKSRADAESKKVENERKIQLLQSALKRYKNLHILDDVVEDEDTSGPDGERKDNLRSKPLSGTLHVTLRDARELEHAPVVTRFRSSSKLVMETSVSIKVEGTQLARSHPSRTDRWNEEFEIAVDKANEVEIAVFDKQVGELHSVPIGLLWIRISDLVEAQRRQKVVMESGQGGWVTAGAIPGDASQQSPTDAPLYGNMSASGATIQPPSGPMTVGAVPADGIDAWFAVEPVGAINLQLNFIKENVRKRPLDAPLGGLGRQGAVRKRKDEVHEMNGHKFVQRQFYQLMLCAFCGDFLFNAAGYQCEDCRYTCHKKCYEKVVTKCISKSNTGADGDEEKINHRIPHRFEPLTNIGANWCCHCGYMLPLGRKNARKCSECDITCHANCAHLVPDFCGMSMETANELLRNWRDINRVKQGQGRKQTRPQPTQAATPLRDSQLSDSMERMRVGSTATQPPQDAYGRLSVDARYSPPSGADARYQQQPQYAPPGAARPSPARVMPPAYPSEAPGRTASGDGYAGYQQQPQPQRLPVPGKPTVQAPAVRPPAGFVPPGPPPPLPGQQPMGGAIQVHGQQPVGGAAVMAQQQMGRVPSKQAQARRRKVGLDDFNFLAVLGKGNFGKVMLAEEKRTNALYAIKVLKKEFIIDNDEVESTRSEKRVFLAAARERHPFLLGLHSCFQTETRVYFVMEYVSGGDLMLHIQRKQFSLRQAKFYATEVLLALEYFHANGIVYRDLKLDNILLTLDGHVKVADYGLCKEEIWYGNTTSTFCGTPEFMAPEILLEQRYGRAVDWWAFGVLTYEMLLGQSPFRGDDEDEIFDAILEDEPLYPITMPRDAVSVLQKLLERDPTRRLGSGKEDAEEIKRQPFFKDVNFDDVMNKRIPPPYFPSINGSADTSNFDEEFTREQPTLTPVHGQLTTRDQQEFEGFSWVATWADI